MTKAEFDKAMLKFSDKIGAFASIVRGGQTIVTIREVDKHVEKFRDNVVEAIPERTGALRRSVRLRRTIRKGVYGRGIYYGWRLVYEGKKYNTPFGMIANIINYGRAAGIDVRGVGYSKIEGINFIGKNLDILSRINPAIAENLKIGGWRVTDEDLTLNDGTVIKMATVLSIALSATSFSELKRQSVLMED